MILQTSQWTTMDGRYTKTMLTEFCGSVTSATTLTFNAKFCSQSDWGFFDCHYQLNLLQTRTRYTNLKLKNQIRCLFSWRLLLFLSIFLSLSVTSIIFFNPYFIYKLILVMGFNMYWTINDCWSKYTYLFCHYHLFHS